MTDPGSPPASVDEPASPFAGEAGPYKGLAPFTVDDAEWFFGREKSRQIVAANLMSERLTIVYGESGVGKSSLLAAGVAHHLRREARRNLAELGTPEFLVVEVAKWQDDPLTTIHEAMVAAAIDVHAEVVLPEVGDAGLAATTRTWSRALDVDFLFIFDQFEECFLYHDDDAPFLQQFPDLVNRDDVRANVILALREDRLAKLDRFKGHVHGNLFANRLRIRHLDRESARAAMLGPLELHNQQTGESVSMTDDLVERVLDEVERGRVTTLGGDDGRPRDLDDDGGRVETPFLQLVLSRLWDTARRARDPVMRVGMLNALGGADAIVRSHLDNAMGRLSGAQQAIAADGFRFLVTPGGSKIALGAGDLAAFTGRSEDELHDVLHPLSSGSMSILRTVAPPPGGTTPRFEIFHDVLAPAITRWRNRVEEQRRAGEKEAALAAQVARWRRRVALAAAVAVVVGVAAAVGIVTVNDARRDADHQRLLAEARAAEDPQAALASAIAAVEARDDGESRQLLRRVLSETHPTAVVDDHDAAANSVEFSPDGTQVVTASNDGTARVIDVDTGDVAAVLEGHDGAVVGARHSPDGTRVVTWSLDGTVRVWDAATGGPVHVLDHGDDPAFVSTAPTHAAGPFGPDGRRLATVAGTTAWVWDLDTGEPVLELPHPEGFTGAAPVFSPDGTTLVTGGADGITRRWDAGTGELVDEFRSSDRTAVQRIALDPTGRLLAAAYANGWTALWDLRNGEELAGWFAQDDDVLSLEFSSTGQRLLSAGDRSVQVWATDPPDFVSPPNFVSRYRSPFSVGGARFSPDGNLVVATLASGATAVVATASGQAVTTLRGHDNIVWSAAFGADGDQVATASEDTTVRLWALPGGLDLYQNPGYLSPAVFDDDGDRVVVAGRDGVAWVRDATTGGLLVELEGDAPETGQGVFPMAWVGFDLDGRRVVTVQQTGTTLWDAHSGERLQACCADEGGWEPWAAAFLPGEGDRLLVAYLDNSIRLWDLDDGTVVHTFDDALTLDSSSDGSVLVTQARGEASDGRITVWDGATLQPETSWSTELVQGTAMAPDGETVVTVGVDGSVDAWSTDGDPLFGLATDDAMTAQFSPDGRRLVVGAADGSVTAWSAVDGAYLGGVRAHPSGVQVASEADDGRIVSSGLDGSVRVFTCEICDLPDDELLPLARQRLVDPPG